MRCPFESLSHRERAVAALLLEGLNSKEVAHQLAVQPKWIYACKRAIYRKLRVNSDIAFVVLAARSGKLLL